MEAVPSTIVAGQSFQIHTMKECPAGTSLIETEVLPVGAPIDGVTDSSHVTWRVSGPNSPGGLYRGYPDLLAGKYEVASECLRGYDSGEALEVIYTYNRASLNISEGGRSVLIEPDLASPGVPITVAPGKPCVDEAGQKIELYLYSPGGGYSNFPLGTTDSSCEWGPLTFVLPTGLPPGEYSAEVLVSEPEGSDGDFAYLPTVLFVI